MNRLITAILILMFLVGGSSLTLIAAELPGNADGTIGTGSGSTTGSGSGPCAFGQFLNQLGQRESSNNYQAKNGYGFIGRWQMHPNSSLADIGWVKNGVWTGNATNFGVKSEQDFLNNSAAQDQAMKEWMDLLAKRGRSFGVTDYLGKTIKGCKITWSGLIAGRHLCGYGSRTANNGRCAGGTSLLRFLNSNGTIDGKDGNGTPVSEYVCKFSGLNMPYNYPGAKATDCSNVENMGETGNSDEPITYPGNPGTGKVPPEEDYDSTRNTLADMLKYTWVTSFQLMTTELTNLMMSQVQAVGTFFDAKHQLETQRLMQQKVAQAHKDYHPSEQMCMIGTFSRNLMNAEIRKKVTKTAITNAILDRALATSDSKTAKENMDQSTRERALIDTFCNPKNNANGNSKLCSEDIDPQKINADINFTKTIDMPLTLDVDFMDDEVQPAEENIFAFLDYIFMHEKFPWKSRNTTVFYNFIEPYMDMRSLISIRSVAQNSFAEIIAQKTSGVDGDRPGEQVGPFMKALLREFGIEDNEIEAMIGENPSYYAQMEILTKTIYQHPDFIANLYDKPANVKRIRAALTAIKLMQDRDIHEALLRREMLMSMLLELQLRRKQLELINDEIIPLNRLPAGQPDSNPPPSE
jgi:hypothetical protein